MAASKILVSGYWLRIYPVFASSPILDMSKRVTFGCVQTLVGAYRLWNFNLLKRKQEQKNSNCDYFFYRVSKVVSTHYEFHA